VAQTPRRRSPRHEVERQGLPEIQDVLTKRYKNRLKQATQTISEDAFQTYVNAYASTYDPHTQYFSPRTSENFNINMSLSLEGIGAVLRTTDDYTEVGRLVPAGPADKAGTIKPADRIIGVGQGDNGKLIDVVGWRLDDVVELIRGPKSSIVRLEIIPANTEDSTSRVITITRNTVQLEEQSAQKKLLTLQQGARRTNRRHRHSDVLCRLVPSRVIPNTRARRVTSTH
jgi:carboxyl-terminal processing protease